MTEHIESEKKRLLSLKRKKEAFKEKEQFIRDALKNVDNKKVNNKIVFDDNIEESIVVEKKEKKRKTLFDDDEDNKEEVIWDDEVFDKKKNMDEKYMKLQASFGNDSRFTLDDRFIEKDKEDGENEEENGEYDLQKEKEWQFNILEDILGQPIGTNKPKDQETIKKYAMIRYDPTEDKHREYELTAEQIESSTKAKKKKKKVEIPLETNESDPVEVSKDVYYSVSNTLTKSLKQEGGFSLLKLYGKEDDKTVSENVQNAAIDTEVKEDMPKKQRTFLNFDSKNPFKYDSSDDENEPESNVQQLLNHKQEEETSNLFGKYSDNLFFSSNDSRFKDALNFFKKESVPNNEFKSLRRELKQIVRTKVRKNVRKTEWWGSKRKIRKPS
ncbi:hypothetical protein KPH14_002261 [Odynerus spinipes]|uniref:Uncharacterized protein n=1 Tax=Odynerus spinipes TaxID=1348599 RepID=A0AAD9RM95_9HYME|nr:hypothetical protein KPH14_002261 [Odynerus spinipes]